MLTADQMSEPLEGVDDAPVRDEVEALRAEVERLRTALEWYGGTLRQARFIHEDIAEAGPEGTI